MRGQFKTLIQFTLKGSTGVQFAKIFLYFHAVSFNSLKYALPNFRKIW